MSRVPHVHAIIFQLKFSKQQVQYVVAVRSYLGADLIAALASLDVHDFTHVCCGLFRRLTRISNDQTHQRASHNRVCESLSFHAGPVASAPFYAKRAAAAQAAEQVPARSECIRARRRHQQRAFLRSDSSTAGESSTSGKFERTRRRSRLARWSARLRHLYNANKSLA